jgi:hypothetical protein
MGEEAAVGSELGAMFRSSDGEWLFLQNAK